MVLEDTGGFPDSEGVTLKVFTNCVPPKAGSTLPVTVMRITLALPAGIFALKLKSLPVPVPPESTLAEPEALLVQLILLIPGGS
ncbi:hypothetical protein D3C71_1559470 [compost metagenome]